MDPSDIPGSSKTNQKRKRGKKNKEKSKKEEEQPPETFPPNPFNTEKKDSENTNLNTDETKIPEINKSSSIKNSQQNVSKKSQTNKKKQNIAQKSDTDNWRQPAASSPSQNGQQITSKDGDSVNQNYQQSQPGSSKSKNYKNQNTKNTKKKSKGQKQSSQPTFPQNVKFTGFFESDNEDENNQFISFDPIFIGIDTAGSISFLFTETMDIESSPFRQLPLDCEGIKAMFQQFTIQRYHPVLCTTIGVNASHNNEMLKLFIDYGNHYLPQKFVVITNFHIIGQIWELNIDGKFYPTKTCINSGNNTTANLIKLKAEFGTIIDENIYFYITESIPERLFKSIFPNNPFRSFFFQPSFLSELILKKSWIIGNRELPDTVYTLNRCLEIRLNGKVIWNFYCGNILPIVETIKTKTDENENKLEVHEIDSNHPLISKKFATVYLLPKSKEIIIKFFVNLNGIFDVKVITLEDEDMTSLVKCSDKKHNPIINFYKDVISVEIFKDGKYVPIKNDFGLETIPLYFSFKNQEPVMGYEALKDFEENRDYIFYDLIKIITTNEYIQYWPFSITQKRNNEKFITLKTYDGIADIDLNFMMSIVIKMVKEMIKSSTNKEEEPYEVEIEFKEIKESIKLKEIVTKACKKNSLKAIFPDRNIFSWYFQTLFARKKYEINAERIRSKSL